MTTKNLVATIMAAVLSVTLLTGVRFANTQADAKSVVAPEATILPSTRVEELPPPKPGSAFSHPVKVVKKSRTQKASRAQVRKPAAARPVTVAAGIRASAWTGRGYDPRWESVRKCIVHRESRGNYNAKNPYSSAQGAYQFLDNLWRRTLAEKLNKPNLAGTPIMYWSRLDQDRAFWLVWDHGNGKSHWSLPGGQCW